MSPSSSLGSCTQLRSHRWLMHRLSDVWEKLYPAERHRIVNLMIERVDLVQGGLKVRWRELGWKDLIGEFARDGIGAELVEMEAIA